MDKEMFEFNKNAILGKIAQPLCTEYKQAWRACGDDKGLLVKLALSQQSLPYLSHACYSRMGLSKEYITSKFGDYINGNKTIDNADGVSGYTYQIYVDYNKDFDITSDVTAMMWVDGSTVYIPETKCPSLYISNNSDVHIVCNGYNSIRVYLFDESTVTIEDADENSFVVVYKYGNRATVDTGKYCLGNVKIFNKELRL